MLFLQILLPLLYNTLTDISWRDGSKRHCEQFRSWPPPQQQIDDFLSKKTTRFFHGIFFLQNLLQLLKKKTPSWVKQLGNSWRFSFRTGVHVVSMFQLFSENPPLSAMCLPGVHASVNIWFGHHVFCSKEMQTHVFVCPRRNPGHNEGQESVAVADCTQTSRSTKRFNLVQCIGIHLYDSCLFS